MLVRLDTKNWLGKYNSRVQYFQGERHLSNYLAYMAKREYAAKIIGHEIITN